MECVLEAYPDPDITWFQGSKSIADSPRVRMVRKATGKYTFLLTLEISHPTREDGGNYRCNAFNIYGESNANISLNFAGTTRKYQTTKYSRSNLWLRNNNSTRFFSANRQKKNRVPSFSTVVPLHKHGLEFRNLVILLMSCIHMCFQAETMPMDSLLRSSKNQKLSPMKAERLSLWNVNVKLNQNRMSRGSGVPRSLKNPEKLN